VQGDPVLCYLDFLGLCTLRRVTIDWRRKETPGRVRAVRDLKGIDPAVGVGKAP
jgi:hypothetical protein